jgi:hypothetical protein
MSQHSAYTAVLALLGCASSPDLLFTILVAAPFCYPDNESSCLHLYRSVACCCYTFVPVTHRVTHQHAEAKRFNGRRGERDVARNLPG